MIAKHILTASLMTGLLALPACADSGKADLTTSKLATTEVAKTSAHVLKHEEHDRAEITLINGDNLPDFALSEAPDDHVIGATDAPVTIIAYFSVTCPHCSDWFTNQWPTVKKSLVEAGKVRFVFRELPTAPQQLSMIGFVIAQCAPDDKYFEVIEYQMENQKLILDQAQAGQGREAYQKVAQVAGLNNEAALENCLSDPSHIEHIHRSSERATAGKIRGVPAFFINGELYDGAQEADVLIRVIDNMNQQGLSKFPTNLP